MFYIKMQNKSYIWHSVLTNIKNVQGHDIQRESQIFYITLWKVLCIIHVSIKRWENKKLKWKILLHMKSQMLFFDQIRHETRVQSNWQRRF